ncbi:MAG: hypothetical protein P3A32_07010 [Gemmatimonadota bacterium]|jgi:hypothetical protein|nr:hypothetical protein [Gemmatimonadota bacterium]MDQ8147164.1 hypothetical protein [Gemmatimonadota bacterium]MDQ8149553.1 hypothetical protein [Gemmatimonadota bacterium]
MMRSSLLRAPLAWVLAVALVTGACAERLETGATCPILCPGQTLDILDTVLTDVVAVDSAIGGFPFLGTESPMLLANRGDTLDVRVIVRFDTLTRVWAPVGDTARPITYLDSLALRVQLLKTAVALPATAFIDAYDVTDTAAVDSLPAQLTPRFAPEHLLGSLQIDSTGFGDSLTVRIPLDTAKFFAILADSGRALRIGLRIRAAGSVAVQVRAAESGANGPSLRYRVSADTIVAAKTVLPSSKTPISPDGIKTEYADYSYVVRAPAVDAPSRLLVGGLPGRRTYIRFALPRWLTDSVAVLSARLELVQDPLRALDPTRTMKVRGQLVLAGHAMTDLGRAARLLAPAGTAISDSIVTAVGDSGVVRLEMNGAIRQWRTVNGSAPFPPAIVLRPDVDGTDSPGVRFFSAEAPAGLRPRLRISYVPAIRYGRP